MKCEMNDHFQKIEPEATAGEKEKLQSETIDQNNRDSKGKYSYYWRGRYRQQNKWQYSSGQQR